MTVEAGQNLSEKGFWQCKRMSLSVNVRLKVLAGGHLIFGLH